MGVRDLVSGDEPRSDRAEGVAALALGPLTGPLALQGPFGHIISEEVARNMIESPRLGYILRLRSNHDPELDLPVQLVGAAGSDDVVIGADDRARRFHKHNGLGGRRIARLSRVIDVIKPNTDELSYAAETGSDPIYLANDRQRFWVARCNLS